MNDSSNKIGHNIGFVGTRFAGTDGVSLEASKWAQLLWDYRHVSYWFAGRLDTHPDISMHVPHAHFGHPDIQWINERIFGHTTREPEVSHRIFALADHLKQQLYEFRDRFNLEILVIENALTIPMNVPLGVAITMFLAETGMPAIAHHHDFYWERDRFAINCIRDLLSMSFPSSLPSIQHATISTEAQRSLSHRRGLASLLVPNVLDFENPPADPDEYTQAFKADIGLEPDDIMILQPTRVVPRKGIEHSIGLVAALENERCKLVVTHESGDEGDEYLSALHDMAELQNVELHLVSHRVGEIRATDESGGRIYTLEDAYAAADFITYPSLYEGFGNALIEAFYHRKPVLVNRYSIFVTDIEPRGFQTVTMNGYLTRDVVRGVREMLENDERRRQVVDENYELGRRFFSYSVLRRSLRTMITNITGAEDL